MSQGVSQGGKISEQRLEGINEGLHSTSQEHCCFQSFEALDEGFCVVQLLFDQQNKPCDYRFEQVNSAFAVHTGLSCVQGKTARELLPDGDDFWFEAIGKVAQSGVARRFEHQSAALKRWFDVYAFRVSVPGQYRVGVLLRDVSDRKRVDERRLIQIAELQHRFNNALTQVQSLANLTLRSTRDPAKLLTRFQQRVFALSAAHKLLGQQTREGADIVDIVKQQVQPGKEEDIRIAGPSVPLAPRVSVTLGLVLHELITNAREHGALSSHAGRLEVEWKVLDQTSELQLDWRELNGPSASAPDERGFGLTLIERGLSGTGGSAHVEFASTGIVCVVTVPITPC